MEIPNVFNFRPLSASCSIPRAHNMQSFGIMAAAAAKRRKRAAMAARVGRSFPKTTEFSGFMANRGSGLWSTGTRGRIALTGWFEVRPLVTRSFPLPT